MDLRHTRTFVTVAEMGTVSKAALRLRLTQPALSRQISDLEHELGLRLFDRVGRRLLLTSEGEQLLSECRALLTHAGAVRERAELLRRGDRGVLKVAASPQHIESVFSQFLHRYAERYPNVEVKVSEGTGNEILAMLERGDIHLGQNLLHSVRLDEQRFGPAAVGGDRAARRVPSVTEPWQTRLGRNRRACALSIIAARRRFRLSARVRRGGPLGGAHAEDPVRKPLAPHFAGFGRSGPRRRGVPVGAANTSLCAADRPSLLPWQASARAIDDSMGQAPHIAALRQGILPDAGRPRPQSLPDLSTDRIEEQQEVAPPTRPAPPGSPKKPADQATGTAVAAGAHA